MDYSVDIERTEQITDIQDTATASGGMSGGVGRQMARLLVLQASEWRRRTSAQEKTCSCAHCASDSVL